MSDHKTVIDMIHEAVEAIAATNHDEPISYTQIADWIIGKHGERSRNSIRCDIVCLSVNVQSRVQFNNKKRKDSDRVTNLAISPDGKTVLACTRNGVFLSDASTGHLQRTLTGHAGATNNALVLVDGSGLITTGDDAVTIIWSMKTWKPIQRVQAHSESVRCLCASPDGRHFATGSNDDTVVIWDARTGKPVRRLGMFGGDVIGLEYSSDGSKLGVSRHWQGAGVFVVDTKTWKPTLYAHAPMWNTYFAWSPDGRRIVACGGSVPSIFEIP